MSDRTTRTVIILILVQLFLMPVVGMSQGLMPIVGYNYGARNFQRMWRAVRTATVYSTVVTFTAQALLLPFALKVYFAALVVVLFFIVFMVSLSLGIIDALLRSFIRLFA